MSGNGIGTGAGGLLGTLAGVALAPETGGLSLAIPAALGAAGSELGNLATGNQTNPLMAAFMGGVGGGLGGATGFGSSLVGSNALGLGDAAGSALAGTEAMPAGLAAAEQAATPAAGAAANTGSAGIDSLVNGFSASQAAPAATGAVSGAAPSASGLASWIGTPKSTLQTATLGNMGLSAIQALTPKPQVNVGQNAANVMATNPNFNSALPKYTMQNTATPYAGNWYTYGETPQAPMYNAQPVLAQAKGGIIHHPFLKKNRGYAEGGMVHGYAMGGQPMMPQGMPPAQPQQPMPQGQAMPQQAAKPINPLTLMAAHKIGVAVGRHLKKHGYTPDGQVHGAGKGQDDAIPARLSQDEYIVPADVVSHLGDGSSNAGGKELDHMVAHVRKQKAVKGFPPKSRNPLSYMKGA